MKYSPAQLIQIAIINKAIDFERIADMERITESPSMQPRQIDIMYDQYDSDGSLDDCHNEVRCSGIPTGIPAQSSRHYDSQVVAIQVLGRGS